MKKKINPKGHYNIIDVVISELRPIVDTLNEFPTATYLNSIGKSSLSSAIRKHGGSYKIAKMMGCTCKEYPKGFWKKKENVISKAKELIDKYGYLPPQKELTKLGLSQLNHSSREFFGGLNGLRKYLGLDLKMKPSGYWTKEIIIGNFYTLKSELGHQPSFNELDKAYGSGYTSAINDKFGKFNDFLQDIGAKFKFNKSYLEQSKNNVIELISLLKEKYGHLPTFKNMNDEGYHALPHYIANNYSSINDFFNSIDEDYKGKKPKSYWIDDCSFDLECQRIESIYGCIPTTNVLEKGGESGFLHGTKFHGGIKEIRHKRSGVFPKQNAEYWKCFDNIKTALNLIIKDSNHFPSWNEINLSSHLPVTALKYHGGIKKVRKKMGYNNTIRTSLDGHENDSIAECMVDDVLFKNGVTHTRGKKLTLFEKTVIPDFILSPKLVIEVLMVNYNIDGRSKREIEYTEKYLKKKKLYIDSNIMIIEVFPDIFSSKKKYIEGMNNLLTEINNTLHLSIDITISMDDFFLSKHGFNYWSNIDNLLIRLIPICKELGRFPSRRELNERNLGFLSRPIDKHGGTAKIAKVLGYSYYLYRAPLNGRKPCGYWNDTNNILKALKKLIEELGHFPLKREMPNNLSIAISRRGGIAKFRKLLN